MTTVTKTDRSIKRTNQNNSSSNAPALNRTDLWPTYLHSAWTELIYFDEQGWVQNANDVFCFLQVRVNPRLLPATVVMVTRTLSRWEGVAGNSTPWESSPYLLSIATTTKTQPSPCPPPPKAFQLPLWPTHPAVFKMTQDMWSAMPSAYSSSPPPSLSHPTLPSLESLLTPSSTPSTLCRWFLHSSPVTLLY